MSEEETQYRLVYKPGAPKSFAVALALIQARETAKALARELAKPIEIKPIEVSVPVPTVPRFEQKPHPISLLYPPYQSKKVDPGASETIYNFVVPSDCVFHIELVGNNWFEDCYAEWHVDGTLVEKVEREIGSINNPVNIRHRWLAAKHTVTWRFYNNSKATVVAGVVLDGTIYLKRDFERMLGVG